MPCMQHLALQRRRGVITSVRIQTVEPLFGQAFVVQAFVASASVVQAFVASAFDLPSFVHPSFVLVAR